MKLIKETTSKESIPGKKSTRRLHGIFECPVCQAHVEKPITHGNRNKSCGNKECRKAVFSPNPDQVQNGGGKKINIDSVEYSAYNKLEFYGNIKSFYQTIHGYQDVAISEDIDTLSKFIELFYAEYASIRTENPSASLILKNDSSSMVLSSKSKIFVKKVIKATKDDYTGEFEWCSHKMANELNVLHDTVRNNANKMFTDIESKDFRFKVNSSSSTMIFSKDQYDKLSIAILHNKSKNKSTNVYLIKSMQYTKIGIASNVNSRLRVLDGSSPFPVELLYSVEIGENASIVETYLHKKYKHKQVNHEWFDLSSEDISDICNVLKAGYDVKIIKELEEAELNKLIEKKENQKLRLAKSKRIYQMKLDEMRKANEKPIIETVTNQEMPELDDSYRIEKITKHGLKGTTAYKAWQAMKAKARDKGFTVCSEWIDNPQKFWDDVEHMYNKIDGRPAMMIKDRHTEYNIGSISVVPLSQASTMNGRTKRVLQLTQDGNLIAVFDSAHDASRRAKVPNGIKCIPEKINAVTNGKRATHACCCWTYEDELDREPAEENWIQLEEDFNAYKADMKAQNKRSKSRSAFIASIS